MSPSRWTVLFALALAAVTLLVYLPVCRYPLVNLDDPDYVQDNPLLRAGPIEAFTTIHAGYWIPLTWISYQLDDRLFGYSPGAFHRTNLLLHVANGVLLFLLLKRMTGSPWSSIGVAALFSLHPLQVESVAWITERKDVLSIFFGLLALHAYVGYAAAPGRARYLLVVLWFTLSLLAKPMLVTLPGIMLLLDYWPLQRWDPAPRAVGARMPGARWLLLEKTPFILLAAAFACTTVLGQRQGDAVRSLEEFPLTARLGNAVVSCVQYLESVVWPVDLAVFYPHAGTPPIYQVVGAAALLAGITTLVLWRFRCEPYLAVGWFWFIGTLLPVSGILQAGWQGRADRFLYFPSIGLFLLACCALAHRFGSSLAARRTLAGIAVCLFALLAVQTREQVGYWQNSVILWEHARQVTPDNFYTRFSYGAALLDAGRVEEAAEQFARAIELKPDHPFGHYELGMARRAQGRTEEAIACWTTALQLQPNYAEAQAAITQSAAERHR